MSKSNSQVNYTLFMRIFRNNCFCALMGQYNNVCNICSPAY